ncbi:hypothetical protein [Pantoea ananatis]|uniref:hypothetical protein n=1 Tax=Pantoea ananas TaxID=553 RepID=UPI001B312EE7|nr:hypothetical protein [Pantoea ananatis]
MTYIERNKWIITSIIALMILVSGLMANELGINMPILASYIIAGILLVISGIQAYFTNTISSKIMRYLVLAVVIIAAITTVYKLFI